MGYTGAGWTETLGPGAGEERLQGHPSPQGKRQRPRERPEVHRHTNPLKKGKPPRARE
jgi:hypothetical protein